MKTESSLCYIILLLSSTGFFFMAFELAIREWTPHINLLAITGRIMSQGPIDRWADEDAFCAYQPRPGVAAEGKTVNSHGHISTPEVAFEKREGTIRILFLGGSSTAGTGSDIPDSITWPWQTVNQLAGKGLNVDFINGAAGGYTTFESYGRLWSRLRFFNPDIVVLNHGWNDSYYINRLDEWPTSWRSNAKGGTGYHYLEYMEDLSPLAMDRFIAWSQMLTRLRLTLYHEPGQGMVISEDEFNQPIESTYNPDVLNIYVDNVKLIRNFCVENAIELFVIKQPSMLTRSRVDSANFHWSGHTLSVERLLEVLEAFHSVADTIVSPSRIIDLRPLSGDADLFADQVHPTFKGCSAFADIVSSHLLTHWPYPRKQANDN